MLMVAMCFSNMTSPYLFIRAKIWQLNIALLNSLFVL